MHKIDDLNGLAKNIENNLKIEGGLGDPENLKTELAKIENFIKYTDANKMPVKDDALLEDAVRAAGNVKNILEEMMNSPGGAGIGKNWNASWHLLICLSKILNKKEGIVTPDEWEETKEYFRDVKSGLPSNGTVDDRDKGALKTLKDSCQVTSSI